MKLFVFTAACMILAAGLLLIGAYCHQGIRGAVSWLRDLPAFRPHAGHHVHGSSLARDYPYLPVPAAQSTVALAGYLCCVHCADGSPCEPRDSHPEPCFECDGMLTPAAAAEHADAMHELAKPFLPPSPEGENPYPPYVPASQPVQRVHAEGDPFTGEMPILTEAAILAWKAERDREWYVRAHEDAVRQVVYGEKPVLAVDEAQRLAAGLST